MLVEKEEKEAHVPKKNQIVVSLKTRSTRGSQTLVVSTCMR